MLGRKENGMPHFEWKPDYSVGVAQIDLQHKRLVELLPEPPNY